jgi:hypothetical protein
MGTRFPGGHPLFPRARPVVAWPSIGKRINVGVVNQGLSDYRAI